MSQLSLYKNEEIKAILVIAFVGLVTFLLDTKSIFIFVVIFGHAHFLLGYLYKIFSKNNQRVSFLRFIILAPIFFLLGSFVYFQENSLPYLIFLTLFIFTLHLAIDDTKIFGFENNEEKVVPIFFITGSYSLLFYHQLFFLSDFSIRIIFGLVIVLAVVLGFRVLKSVAVFKKLPPESVMIIFGLVPLISLFLPNTTIYGISGFIILYHYIRWYVYYYTKLQREERVYFVNLSVAVNALFMLLAVIYALSGVHSSLVVLFHPAYFYAWTLIHIFVSFNYSDIKCRFFGVK